MRAYQYLLGIVLLTGVTTASAQTDMEMPVQAIPALPIPTETDSVAKYDLAEVAPEFPGGNDNIMQFVVKNIEYPEYAKENDLEGRVYVQFFIDKDGSVQDAHVIRGVADVLDKEALRVVNKMPNWTPGTMKGEPVRVKFVLPISFRLE